jgi:hypothetical protein
VHRGLGQLQPPVPAHGVDDVDEQRLRDGVAGEADERVDDLLRVVPGSPGVPQGQRGDAVGVDVLRRAFELREGGDRRAGLRRRPRGRSRAAGSCRTGRSVARRAQRFLPTASPGAGAVWSCARLGRPGTSPSAPGEERHTGRCTPRGPLSRTGYTPAPRTHACRADHTGLPRPSPSPSGRVGARSGPASGRPADRPGPDEKVRRFRR